VLTLVGNKIDLENRQVKSEDAVEYAKTLGLAHHEVSAKQDIGIEKLFTEIARQLPKESINKKKNALNLKKSANKDEGGMCGC